ncbi:hypothetical protein [Candidatus Lucifugimonas marina]
MKIRHTRMNIGTQVRVAKRSTSLVSFLPIALFAALVTAIAFIG